MKKTTYAVIFLCICMLLSACQREGREGRTAESPKKEERVENGKETAAEEKAGMGNEKVEYTIEILQEVS